MTDMLPQNPDSFVHLGWMGVILAKELLVHVRVKSKAECPKCAALDGELDELGNMVEAANRKLDQMNVWLEKEDPITNAKMIYFPPKAMERLEKLDNIEPLISSLSNVATLLSAAAQRISDAIKGCK